LIGARDAGRGRGRRGARESTSACRRHDRERQAAQSVAPAACSFGRYVVVERLRCHSLRCCSIVLWVLFDHDPWHFYSVYCCREQKVPADSLSLLGERAWRLRALSRGRALAFLHILNDYAQVFSTSRRSILARALVERRIDQELQAKAVRC
jgi:hypothetical protein